MGKRTSEFAGSVGPFQTREEAQAKKPATDKRRLFVVTTPEGKTCWTWADGSNGAVLQVAKGPGFSASVQDKAPTREKVAGMLAQLSDEDRSLLIRMYVPAPEQPAGPAAERGPAGKGKK